MGQGGGFTFARPSLRKIQEIPQDRGAMLGGDALRVELHAMHRQLAMRQRHDQPVAGRGLDLENVGQLARSTTSEW